MNITKTLRLTFADENGKTYNLNLRNPKENLEKEAVEEAMNKMISGSVLAYKGEVFTEAKEANMIVRETKPIF